ncbi:hypothetical protein QBC46DRAFT_376813 [Diplogelasinospora grovesii]|uniref:J domain-containing protein n=1 Tax=Diplogelasinospora grovesii TaxID=303347 RepID=A0AAN6NDB1_9PEZI|nr:hypothetical protein QBC46DRAFT_376813 [Diplogelasinospora grovesii]
MEYSPFDALGLDPKIHTNNEIKSAFKRAALHCHPDCRQQHWMPLKQWPTMDHLTASLTYLLFNDKANAVRLFSNYPRTFFPNYPSRDPRIYQPIPKRFRQFVSCPECGMVLRKDSQQQHRAKHQ